MKGIPCRACNWCNIIAPYHSKYEHLWHKCNYRFLRMIEQFGEGIKG